MTKKKLSEEECEEEEEPLTCGFTVIFNPGWKSFLSEIKSKLDAADMSIGDVGNDYIAGTISTGDPDTTESGLRRILNDTVEKMPVKLKKFVKSVHLDECS